MKEKIKKESKKDFEIPTQDEIRAYLAGVENGDIDSEVEPGNFFLEEKTDCTEVSGLD